MKSSRGTPDAFEASRESRFVDNIVAGEVKVCVETKANGEEGRPSTPDNDTCDRERGFAVRPRV